MAHREAGTVRRRVALPTVQARPSYGAAPPSFNDFVPMDDRGRPFKNKGSRRNIRRRKRGFD